MNTLFKALFLAATLQLAGLAAASAQSAKTYQVTGPVLELSDKLIVVDKGGERWEVARDEKTKIEGVLKVGAKVTIRYRMLAIAVEAKSDKGSGNAK